MGMLSLVGKANATLEVSPKLHRLINKTNTKNQALLHDEPSSTQLPEYMAKSKAGKIGHKAMLVSHKLPVMLNIGQSNTIYFIIVTK